jgi:hypothetical protein
MKTTIYKTISMVFVFGMLAIVMFHEHLPMAIVLAAFIVSDTYLFSRGWGGSMFHEVRTESDQLAYKKVSGVEWKDELNNSL